MTRGVGGPDRRSKQQLSDRLEAINDELDVAVDALKGKISSKDYKSIEHINFPDRVSDKIDMPETRKIDALYAEQAEISTKLFGKK